MPVNVRPTKADKVVARIIARNTTPATEQTAEALTWGADEHTLCAAAAIWWLYCRGRPAAERAASNHVLITTTAATILPHLMKCIFTQERPDRRSFEAHLHGAPFQGALSSPFRPATHFISVHLPPLPLSSRDNSALSPGRRVRFWLLLEFFSLRTGRATSRRV
jgi:antitoxin (DNA-binding transcriptional repressor) of toxin-antitoxin stability system